MQIAWLKRMTWVCSKILLVATFWVASSCDRRFGPLKHLSGDFPAKISRFSNDGQRLLIGRTDGLIQIWSYETDDPPVELSIGSSLVDVSWSADNSKIVTAGMNGKISIWDVSTSSPTEQVIAPANSDQVNQAFFSQDGVYLIAETQNSSAVSVHLWNLKTPNADFSLQCHRQPILSKDGSKLLTIDLKGNCVSGTKGQVVLFAKKPETAWARVLDSDPYPATVSQAFFLPDEIGIGMILTDTSSQNLLCAERGPKWEVKLPCYLLPSAYKMSFSENNSRILLVEGGENPRLRLIPDAQNSLTTGVSLATSPRVLNGTNEEVLFSPSGDRFAEARLLSQPDSTYQYTLDLRNPDTGEDFLHLLTVENPLLRPGTFLPIQPLAFSSDGTRLAASSTDNDVFIWGLKGL